MKTRQKPRTVRHSIALPRELVVQLQEILSHGPEQTMNRLVTRALSEFVERQQAEEFSRAMSKMASDPSIRKECATISREFSVADADGSGDV